MGAQRTLPQPAFLVPLVEVSAHDGTKSSTTNELKELFEEIGKVPVLCKASLGYVVLRIQIGMNEAARLVEEGIATA